jgi:hypothetical protein
LRWRANRREDGTIDPDCAVSDTHTIIRALPQLFISYRRGNKNTGKVGHIIGRWSTAILARKCCESDYEGKPFPPDTLETYPPESPTLDMAKPQENTTDVTGSSESR